MRGQEFKARDKKVQKMTRDGLTEKNLATGKEKRVSGRAADTSFGREKTADTAAGNRIQKRGQNPRVSPRGADRRHFGETARRQPPGGDAKDVWQEGKAGVRQDEEGAEIEAVFAGTEEAAAYDVPERGRIFVAGRAGTGRRSEKWAGRRKRAAAGYSGDGAEPGIAGRLHYEKSEIPPQERGGGKVRKDRARASAERYGTKAQGELSGANAAETGAVKRRRLKQYGRVQAYGEKDTGLRTKAEEGLPSRNRAYQQKRYNREYWKRRYRLYFEQEEDLETGKLPSAGRADREGWRTVSAAAREAQRRIRETEGDNVSLEALHEAESAAERGARLAAQRRRRRLRDKPYREMRRAGERLARADADAAYKKLLADQPELEKKALAKWVQKQKIRRSYAAAAREAAKEMKHTANVLNASGGIVRALAQAVASRKAFLGAVGIGVLLISLFGALFSSCSAMLSGVESAIISTCYVADDAEIERSELRYTELETDLQIKINRTEEDHLGYDEYRYHIGEIGHNPFELMGYLSAAYDDFTYAQVEAELSRLFSEQYGLVREEITEMRTYTDDEGEEQEYEWQVVITTLSVRPLAEIISESLAPGEQTDRYGVYMQTLGNRQCYGNPFDVDWISYVASPYGYRVHPISGEKDLHRGVDIGVSAGTPIRAVQDGVVVSAGNAGDYGLCVVVEGEYGYQSRYAHCASVSVSAGQEVKRGDIIAAVGSSGSSTGPHLHLEVSHNGAYLNPYYYVAGGGTGYLPGGGAAGGPEFTEAPGEAMGDGSFAAMLAEAEKYLGFPYVWGGSSPATSFDCSGYVSWVINRSGVGNVGRQTAQGLYNLCSPVSREDMRPGDLVFFTGTYSAAVPVTHVGIYIGGGKMIHCGDPISYADLTGQYWSGHFYSGGRLP